MEKSLIFSNLKHLLNLSISISPLCDITNRLVPPPNFKSIESNSLVAAASNELSNTVIEDWSYELNETEETGIGNISNDNAGTSKHHLFE